VGADIGSHVERHQVLIIPSMQHARDLEQHIDLALIVRANLKHASADANHAFPTHLRIGARDQHWPIIASSQNEDRPPFHVYSR
jgi:hypothetical protein